MFNLDPSRARSVFFSEPFYGLSKKWALFEDGKMMAILTSTPLIFGWGKAIGIAGVATEPKARGRGLGTLMLDRVLNASAEEGIAASMLFAHRRNLYERVGFELVDEVIKGDLRVNAAHEPKPSDELSAAQIRAIYDEWARQDPARLRRDEQRWHYWKWITRSCTRLGNGYICQEPGICREAILPNDVPEWPLPPATTWVGLRNLAKQGGVPLRNEESHLLVMAKGFPMQPLMFMTDQF